MAVLQLDTERGFRGGERQILLLAQGLAAGGVYHPVIGAPARSELLRRAQEAGLEAVSIPFRGSFGIASLRAIIRVAADRGVKIIHAHTAHAVLPATVAAWWLRRWGSRQLPRVVIHRRVDFPIRAWLSRRLKYRLGIAAFIAISSAVKRVLLEAGVPEARVHLVPSGVPPLAPPAAAAEDARAPQGDGCLRVVCVAHLAPHKGHEILLRAMSRVIAALPEASLTLVGHGELEGELRALAAALHLDDRCIFLGFRNDVAALLPHFDVFAMPSLLEGLNTSVLDAMSAGLAVVASRTGGLPDAVADGETGLLVPPGDAAALADALLTLLRSSDLRRRLGEAGRFRATQQFSDSAMVRGVSAVYGAVLAGVEDGGRAAEALG